MGIPHAWDVYRRLQEQLARKCHVDDQSWGLEGALNRFLVRPEELLTQEQVARAVGSQCRRERYRRELVRGLPAQEDPRGTPDGAIDARRHLRLIKNQVSRRDWALLLAVGEGRGYKEIASVTKVTTGTLRVRVLRLRRALAG